MTMSDVLPVRSDCCGLDEMFLAYVPGEAARARLELGPGWTRRWTATWQVSGGDEVSLVRDLGPVPVAGCEPVRRFSWGRRQRHRPGLQFMVSTGRLHGFESLEEQSGLPTELPVSYRQNCAGDRFGLCRRGLAPGGGAVVRPGLSRQ